MALESPEGNLVNAYKALHLIIKAWALVMLIGSKPAATKESSADKAPASSTTRSPAGSAQQPRRRPRVVEGPAMGLLRACTSPGCIIVGHHLC